MACNCGNSGSSAPSSYTVTKPDGSKVTYRTEVEAVAAARRVGGTYAPSK